MEAIVLERGRKQQKCYYRLFTVKNIEEDNHGRRIDEVADREKRRTDTLLCNEYEEKKTSFADYNLLAVNSQYFWKTVSINNDPLNDRTDVLIIFSSATN